MKRALLGWLLAILVAAAGGTLVQVHMNAEAISDLGAPVPFGERLGMLGHDLLNFMPAYAALVAAAFLIAWPVAGGLSRWKPGWRTVWFALAGFSALATMLILMQVALPITVLAPARSAAGAIALCLAGALAGLVHVAWTRPQKSSSA